MADGLFNPSELYEMLRQQNMVPRLIDSNPYGQRNAGLFSQYRNVVVARDPSKVSSPSAIYDRTDVLAHELAHAAQFNLLFPALQTIQSKQTDKEKLTTQEVQFASAMQKLLEDNPSLKSLVNKMYTKTGIKEDDKYRTMPEELQAWGVGYMSRPTDMLNKEKPNINPHLNPSMATEFSILSNLYSKLPDSVKAVSSKLRQEEINKYRKNDREGMVKESMDIFADPFRPTIR